MAKGMRRNKKEIIIDKIEKLEEQILTTEKKLAEFKSERADLKAQLKEIENTELKIKEEAEMNEIFTLIKHSDITFDEIKKFLTSSSKI